MKKSQLKQLIKECIEEILKEGWGEIKIWFTPDGKVVNAGGSHEEWIVQNTNVPKGFTVIDTYDNAVARGYVRGIYDGDMLTLANGHNYAFDLGKVSNTTRNAIKKFIDDKEITIVGEGRGGRLLKDLMPSSKW
jgi:ethanolamine utilization protein EutQ (cupin superfamily)